MIPLMVASVDAAVVLALGLAATVTLRGRSAALRHALLAAAILTAVVMPALKSVLPQFPVVALGGSVGVVSSGARLMSPDALSQSAAGSVAAAAGFPWPTIFLVIWTAGAIVIGAGVVTGLARLSRLKGRCVPVTGRWRDLADELARECGIRRRVILLQSDDPALLVTCGVLQPSIILPAGADAWADDRCSTVLRHELAHISRHDAAMQIAGEALRVLQWINPLTWIACRRLRHESEYACDDAVLSAGIDPTQYATHLLDVARQLSRRRWIPAPAIAEPSTLERRIVAMLHERRNRAPLGRRGRVLTVLAALMIGVPLGAAGVAAPETAAPTPGSDVSLRIETPSTVRTMDAPETTRFPRPDRKLSRAAATSRQTRISLTGTIVDQFGGVLPGVTVFITNPQAGIHVQIVTDAAGSFIARSIPAGQYDIQASLPGFATITRALTLSDGRDVQWTVTMPLGTVQESINVSCSGMSDLAGLQRLATTIAKGVFPVLSAQELGSPIRVGGNVRVPLKTHDVKPVCPSDVPQGDTLVRLAGHIGVDGHISDAVVVESQSGGTPPGDLVNAAIEAVRGWAFKPTLLDGQAVDVAIAVDVTFRN